MPDFLFVVEPMLLELLIVPMVVSQSSNSLVFVQAKSFDRFLELFRKQFLDIVDSYEYETLVF
jgi:hypothetical protein